MMIRTRHSIQEYVIWLTLAPLLVMGISFGTFFLLDRYSELDSDLLTRGQLIARQLAASSEYGVFSNNQAYLKGLAESVLRQPDVESVIVMNAESRILAESERIDGVRSTDAGGTIQAGNDSIKAIAELKSGQSRGIGNNKGQVIDQADALILYQPILSTQIPIEDMEAGSAARQVGLVITRLSKSHVRSLKSKLLWFTVLATALFLLVTGYLVHIFSRRIINPISELSESIQNIGEGDLDTVVTTPSNIREIFNLSFGINRMRAELKYERTVLQHRIDEATEQLRNLAFYDTLTLLPNRRLLTDRLAQSLTACKRGGQYGAVLFIDLDNFKPLNDQFGHAVGDLLLIEVANRIRCCVREKDTVARFGGDEFVVILSELSQIKEESTIQTNIVAEKIRAVIEEEYNLIYQQEGHAAICVKHHSSSSIGVMLFLGEDDQEDILRHADTAMYQAKQAGRNRIHFFNEDKS